MDLKRLLGKRVAVHEVDTSYIMCGDVVAVSDELFWVRAMIDGIVFAFSPTNNSEDRAFQGYWWSEL